MNSLCLVHSTFLEFSLFSLFLVFGSSQQGGCAAVCKNWVNFPLVVTFVTNVGVWSALSIWLFVVVML